MFFPTIRRMEIMPRSTYYDKHYKMTSAMIRARQQYLVKNIFTGAALAVFVLGVYAYTIHAVAQDDFSDLPMPDPLPQPTAPTQNARAERATEEKLGVKQAAVARMRQ